MLTPRGRTSAAALATVDLLPGQRFPPPNELTEEQKDEWRAIVATKPAEWFTPDSHSLLIAHCRHIVQARWLSDEIERCDREDVGLLDKLLRMRDREVKSLVLTARSMRLTHQSRDPSAARTAHERVSTASRKPWEATG